MRLASHFVLMLRTSRASLFKHGLFLVAGHFEDSVAADFVP
jgi:hypothetical protein